MNEFWALDWEKPWCRYDASFLGKLTAIGDGDGFGGLAA